MKKKPRAGKRAAAGRRTGSGKRASSPLRVVLGPQAGERTLPGVFADLETQGHLSPGGTVATITAGWQEREGEVGLLEDDLGRPAVDLRLYERADALANDDPDLAAGHAAVQTRLKELRRAYNRRLAGSMATWAELAGMRGDETILVPERADMLAEIRRLDARHLERVSEVRSEYEQDFRPHERDAVVRQRDEIGSLVDGVDVVAVAGGHVATLLNRLRLFGIVDLLAARTLIAWSAGAMVLGRRIVLFHDSPPWGPGNAEVFENGLGVLDDLLFFPHASRRLDLEDTARTSRLAMRFAPDVCALLDPGTRLDRTADAWVPTEGARCLAEDGSSRPFEHRAA